MSDEHPGSRDTYDTIAQWIVPDFPYSKKDVWHRFGFLGVFADYVLSHLQGDVLEIGVGESSIYLTVVVNKYRRRIFYCDASPSKIINPMTIPGYIMASDELTYLEDHDPVPETLKRGVAYAGPSDTMFKRLPITPLALAFIDGDHLYPQVARDFHNVWPYIVDNGYVLLHDTYPANAEECGENRSGEVWQLRRELERNTRMDCLTLTRGTAMNAGLTIVRKRPLMSEPFQDG